MKTVKETKVVSVNELRAERDHQELASQIDVEEIEEQKERSTCEKIQEIKEAFTNPKKAIIQVKQVESPPDDYFSEFDDEDDQEADPKITKTIVKDDQDSGPLTQKPATTTESSQSSESLVEIHGYTSMDDIFFPIKEKYYKGSPEGPTADQVLLDKYITPKMYRLFRLFHPEGTKIQAGLEDDLRVLREDRFKKYSEGFIQEIEENRDWDVFEKEEQMFILEALDIKCLAWIDFLRACADNMDWFRTIASAPFNDGKGWDQEISDELAESLLYIVDDIEQQREKNTEYDEADFKFAHEVAPFNFMDSIRYSIWWN